MTLQELYDQIGGDYAGTVARLVSERLVQKFVLKFLDDGSYEQLTTSLANGNYDEAFRAAHTIKGMCANLGFTRLQTSSSALTEALRAGEHEVDDLYRQTAVDYKDTVAAIEEFKAGI